MSRHWMLALTGLEWILFQRFPVLTFHGDDGTQGYLKIQDVCAEVTVQPPLSGRVRTLSASSFNR